MEREQNERVRETKKGDDKGKEKERKRSRGRERECVRYRRIWRGIDIERRK